MINLSINKKVILFGFIFTFFSSFGQSFFLGLFNAPIRKELDISHGQFGTIYASATICSSLLLIWVGKKIDEFKLFHYSLYIVDISFFGIKKKIDSGYYTIYNIIIMSAHELITKSRDFDASTVTYKEPRLNKRGGKNISVVLNDNPLVIQFPLMFTWGVNERVDDQNGRVSYDMSISFTSKDSEDPVGEFYHKLVELQEKVLSDAVTHSKLWNFQKFKK